MKRKTTRFILVRHGETVANRERVLQGWTESPLSENGIAQAKAVAEYLRDTVIDAAYASDLSRAADTAGAILKYHPEVKLTLTDSLREWHLGDLERRYIPDIMQEVPGAIESLRIEQLSVKIPGGESREEFQQRVTGFFAGMIHSHIDQTVLICTHGGTMQRIFRMAAGPVAPGNIIPLVDNASVSSINFFHDSGNWQLASWNSKDHLKALQVMESLGH